MQNYFELFAIDIQFDFDLSALELAYQEKIAQFHPDKFTSKSKQEKSIALQNTVLINAAYNTLKSPLLRATYLLELSGINAFDEKDTQMEVNFLMHQIELREQLESIKSKQDEPALDNLIETIDSKITHNVKQIQILFTDNSGLDKIKNLVRELKFYEQLNAHAKQLMDEWL